MFRRMICAGMAVLVLTGCANHPVDCAVGFAWNDCLPGTAGYRGPPPDSGPAYDFDKGDDAVCQSYGAKKGSAPYVECRVERARERQANMSSSMQMQQQQQFQQRQMMGAYLMSHPVGAPYQQPYVVPVHPAYNTSCTTISGITNCQTR